MWVQVGAEYLDKPNTPRHSARRRARRGAGQRRDPGRRHCGHERRKFAVDMGVYVTVIDRNPNRLRQLDDIFNGEIVTLASTCGPSARI